MLNINLRTCTTCIDVSNLLCEIDRKLAEYGSNRLNNTALLLSRPFNLEVANDLIQYKEILTHKLFFPDYANTSLSVITSRVKILLNK